MCIFYIVFPCIISTLHAMEKCPGYVKVYTGKCPFCEICMNVGELKPKQLPTLHISAKFSCCISIARCAYDGTSVLLVVDAAPWDVATAELVEGGFSGQPGIGWQCFVAPVHAAWRSAWTHARSDVQRPDRATVCWGRQRQQFQEPRHIKSTGYLSSYYIVVAWLNFKSCTN